MENPTNDLYNWMIEEISKLPKVYDWQLGLTDPQSDNSED
jgi:hypothetical protein